MAKRQTLMIPVFMVGEVARRTGYSIETLRELDSRGIARPFRTSTGQRLYAAQHIDEIEHYRAQARARHEARRSEARSRKADKLNASRAQHGTRHCRVREAQQGEEA